MFLPDIKARCVKQYSKLPDDVPEGYGYAIYNLKNEKYLDIKDANRTFDWFNRTRVLFTYDHTESLHASSLYDHVPPCWYHDQAELSKIRTFIKKHTGHLIVVECDVYTNHIQNVPNGSLLTSIYYEPDFTKSFMLT
tara:strand:+ start:76 stop:486 length:411 start_codon:yes stop_codon:yes gene_type:complete